MLALQESEKLISNLTSNSSTEKIPTKINNNLSPNIINVGNKNSSVREKISGNGSTTKPKANVINKKNTLDNGVPDSQGLAKMKKKTRYEGSFKIYSLRQFSINNLFLFFP